MTEREALKLALEALENWKHAYPDEFDEFDEDALKAIKETLAQPEQELLAWKNAALRVGEDLSSVGPNGYYNMTAQQWLDWAMAQQPRGNNSLAQPEQLFEENERLHVENRRLIERIETIGVPVGVGGFVTTTTQPEHTHEWRDKEGNLLLSVDASAPIEMAQPEQEPAVFLKEWSDWRNMVVQNLMRHGGIDKDLARRLAHFYQDSAPQRTWVGLDEEEIQRVAGMVNWTDEHVAWNFAIRLEKLLKQKNGYAEEKNT